VVRDVYGKKIRMLTIIDEFTRTCLIVHCARHIGADEVIEQLASAMIVHGISTHTPFADLKDLLGKKSPVK
jgi:hypothetical protein